MNVTELAYWRYRVKALEADVPKTRKAALAWEVYGPSHEEGGEWWRETLDALEDQLALERYLLEEARYMCELAQAQQEADDAKIVATLELHRQGYRLHFGIDGAPHYTRPSDA
jgi:hypothetical protein